MRTRRIEVTITYDQKNEKTAQAVDEFTGWLKDECDVSVSESPPEELREGLHDFTFQKTDIDL